ncbi:MAG: IS66 family insertion sequence element accessory protein TnpB [Candidatus Competibacteraceae bacterium]|jgi:transposase|nr:IS66 family insertion sequence element accessory protein TnpB [Candidatus Competibacteraceae bacterium]
MIHLTEQTVIMLATAPADFRCGIDGLAARVQRLGGDPRSGCLFVFHNRAKTMIRILAYERQVSEAGQGYWLISKRLSRGRFQHWPTAKSPLKPQAAHQLRQLLNNLLSSGDV